MKLENLCEIRHYPSESHLLHSKIDVITFSNDYRGYSSFFFLSCVLIQAGYTNLMIQNSLVFKFSQVLEVHSMFDQFLSESPRGNSGQQQQPNDRKPIILPPASSVQHPVHTI